jgi:hypothetical protein
VGRCAVRNSIGPHCHLNLLAGDPGHESGICHLR